MTAAILSNFGTPIPGHTLESHAAIIREHLERPLRHARYGAKGQLWERVAAPDLPAHLWNGGLPVEDDDLWRKQQIESEIAGY